MHRISDKPTVVLLCYNQELTIADAVLSILRQSFDNFIFNIHDDASTDLTVKIVEELITSYSGRIEVTLYKNDINLGIGLNLDRAVRRSNTELVVYAAGDDVSKPERVERIWKLWQSSEPRFALFSSDGLRFKHAPGDLRSRVIGKTEIPASCCYTQNHNADVNLDIDLLGVPFCGFAAAYNTEIFTKFPELKGRFWSEDDIVRFRARLLGTIVYSSEPLVYYRTGGISTGENVGNPELHRRRYRAQARTRWKALYTFRRDIASVGAAGCYSESLRRQIMVSLNRFNISRRNKRRAFVSLLYCLVTSKHDGISKIELIKFFLCSHFPSAFEVFYKIFNIVKNSKRVFEQST